MRNKIIIFFKTHPAIIRFVWKIARVLMRICGFFLPVQKKTMIFSSLGGRNFGDSPRAIYDEVCNRTEFNDWNLIWAFVEPNKHNIPRGEKVKIDTILFFKKLLTSKVWISNSSMDRGINLKRKSNIRVETWHGLPFKKIGGEENQNSFGRKTENINEKLDCETIRCAQSEYDREIYSRVFHASKDAILLCDLPRNDELLRYTEKDINSIKSKLNIPKQKKVILYAPTYREYLINDNNMYIAPPVDLRKWEMLLGDSYVLLIRAHYAVTEALKIKETDFVRDVSIYPPINELYIITDLLISDYSSVFVDYSILERPMLCYPYDLKEYEEKRGLYIDVEETFNFGVFYTEDSLLDEIEHLDVDEAKTKSRYFHLKFAPYAGSASKKVVDAIVERL